MKSIYAKRSSDIEVNTETRTLSIKTPGTKYDRNPGNERSKLTVTDDQGKTKTYSTETLRKLVINNESKHKGPNELTWVACTKTMPEVEILHKNIMDKDKLKNTHRFDLEKMTYTTPDNQFVLPLKSLDFTEIKVDKDHGIILRTDKEWRQIPLKYLGNANRFLNPLKEMQAKAGNCSIDLKDECLKILNDAYNTNDLNKINEAFTHIRHISANNATDTSSMMKRLDRPPHNEYELKELKKAARDQLRRAIASNSASLRETLKAHNDLDHALTNELKEALQPILNKGNKSFTDDDRKKLLNKLNEIYKAFHFNNTYDFKLLVDPNADEQKPKCDHPTMRMLVEEYEKYMRKGDLSEKERTYVKDIEEFVHGKDDIYLKNEIDLIKANYSTDPDEIIEALRLKQGKFFNNPKNLEERRQNYEYLMVSHLEKATTTARAEGNPELILAPLSDIMSIRQHRLNTLACIEKILNPSSDDPEADISINIKKLADQRSFKISELKDDVCNKKLDDIEAKLDKLIKDNALKKQDPVEYAKRSTELVHQTATLAYQRLVEAFANDPDALRDLDARRVDIMLKMSDQASAAYNTALRLRFFDKQEGLLFKMMWWEIYLTTFSTGSMKLNQFEARIGNVFHKFMSEVFNAGL